MEASEGDSLLMLVFNDARDSNLRRPEEPPPPSLLEKKTIRLFDVNDSTTIIRRGEEKPFDCLR